VILDMGTGAMSLGNALVRREFGKGRGHATILLSHAHWDHIQGFGFFAPIFIPGNRFEVYGNASSPASLEGILEGQMDPHFSPLQTLRNLGATLTFASATPGEAFAVGGATIRSLANPHGRSTALAFRIEEAGRALVYASDVGYPKEGPTAEAIAFYREASLLVHDSTYTAQDQAGRRSRGYSSCVDAADAAIRARAEHLVLFHYDQDYGDDAVDALRDACRAHLDARDGRAVRLTAAEEGLELRLEAP
jgi:phosphoribosyl 1,2-cyclic phosphodiesterase